jgi:hypothetical protein
LQFQRTQGCGKRCGPFCFCRLMQIVPYETAYRLRQRSLLRPVLRCMIDAHDFNNTLIAKPIDGDVGSEGKISSRVPSIRQLRPRLGNERKSEIPRYRVSAIFLAASGLSYWIRRPMRSRSSAASDDQRTSIKRETSGRCAHRLPHGKRTRPDGESPDLALRPR